MWRRTDCPGHPERRAAVHVDAQHLPERGGELLPVALGVAAGAPVPQADVEHPVVAEGEAAAVVVREGLGDEQERALARRVRHVGAGGPELGDVGVARRVGVVHEEPPVRPELRVEREAQQPLLASAADASRDVEERDPRHLAVADDLDATALLDDVEPRAVAGGGLQVERVVQANRHPLRGEGRRPHDRRRRAGGRRGRGRGGGGARRLAAPAAASPGGEDQARQSGRGGGPSKDWAHRVPLRLVFEYKVSWGSRSS